MSSSKSIACLLGCLWLAASGAACAGAKPAVSGKPTFVGVFGLPPERAVNWPFAVTRAAPEELLQVRGVGLKALVALTGAKKNYSDAFGCFQLSLWKQALDRQDEARIRGLVEEGVIMGLYAIDEPHDWACGPSFAEIDAACAYAGTKWPQLKCGVNAPPGWLKPGRAELPHLGFLFFQYASGRGDPETWLAKQMADASWFDGDIWLSIQLLKPRISVSEFRRAALHFCSARPTGLLMWKWSDEWFGQAGVTSAMQEVAAACGSPARTVVGKTATGAP